MWHRRGHVPVLPAPHHPAHDRGLLAVFGRHPASQLFWEPAGYFSPHIMVQLARCLKNLKDIPDLSRGTWVTSQAEGPEATQG